METCRCAATPPMALALAPAALRAASPRSKLCMLGNVLGACWLCQAHRTARTVTEQSCMIGIRVIRVFERCMDDRRAMPSFATYDKPVSYVSTGRDVEIGLAQHPALRCIVSRKRSQHVSWKLLMALRTAASLHLRRITARARCQPPCSGAVSSSSSESIQTFSAGTGWPLTLKDVPQHASSASLTMRCRSTSPSSAPQTMPGVSVPAMDHRGPPRAHNSRQRWQGPFEHCPPASDAHRAPLHSAARASAPARPSAMAGVVSQGMSTAAIVPPPSSSAGLYEAQRQTLSLAAAPLAQPGYVAIEEPLHAEIAPAETVPAVLRASHWITAQRGRSFKDRGLRVRVKVRDHATGLALEIQVIC